MQSKFQSKGLTVLAVTDEGASETEKWVAEKGAKYAYAYDKGGKLARHFGVRGIPDAVLVDAFGAVVWRGHPASLEERTIASALQGALPKPLWEWSGSAKGVKSALMKRSFKSALDQAARLSVADGGPEIQGVIQGMVKTSVDRMKASFDKGDFLGAQTAAQSLQKELAGLPELADASKVLADIAANKNAQTVMKGQQKLAKLRSGENTKHKEITAAIESARKLKQEYPGTYVVTEADEYIAQLDQALKDMKDM
jgi:hypothetical protein